MTMPYERLIALEGAHNVRDLGGYATGTGTITRWRSILRGDGLHLLTASDVDTLLAEGLLTVIDLRNAHEIALEANPFHADRRVRYHNMPLFSALAPIEAVRTGPDPFDMAARYCEAIDTCQQAIAEVLRTIADAPEGLVLFHCSAGKDRTGVISAILLAIAGVEEDAIIEDYALTATIAGPLIERLREKALRNGIDPALVERFLASDPGTMRTMLDHVRRIYGGLPSYGQHIGLSSADLEKLRRRVLD
ncbi:MULTISPECIES: tyrosine-protein phosphatase [unclassified Sinorhizobium]|uniref:tyrosine-protein phosphatase n=1 Tax=unclassified Sinorhizobium TaxID=2613772 RepID=UPI003523E056